MAYNKDIVEKLSQFNNMSFTKKQWDIILKGCGCPKSCHFWAALRVNNLQMSKKLYTLLDIDSKSFEILWELYCEKNRTSVRKSYFKKKVKKQAKDREVNITLYMVNGYLTTEKPTRE